jgi:cytochrome c-type biogenesis protein CcmF
VPLASLGAGCLLAALVLMPLSAATALMSARRRDPRLARIARRLFYGGAVAVAGASAVLLAALVGHDFSIAYVTEHTDRSLPAPLAAAAFYGGQEGSLLYWTLALVALGSLALASLKGSPPPAGGEVGGGPFPGPYANAILAAVASFFLLVLTFVASPFDVLTVRPADGLGLNPILRDGGMLIHPPFLLAGFSAFAVPFALAMAGLLEGRDDPLHGAVTRRFMLVAWALQSTGLVLGMWWAYHVLGWGGYWGWAPVEDVALLPWLAATAHLHVTLPGRGRARGRAAAGLAIAAFLLAIFGTFITRGGILPSVHTFAVSPLGPWFFGFLAVATAGSLAVLSRRGPTPLAFQRSGGGVVSLEGALGLQNLLLVALVAAVLWGVTLPLLSGMIGRELVVGPAYYERVAGPLLALLLAVLAVGPLLPWRDTPRARAAWARRLGWPLGAAVLTAGFLVAAGSRQPAQLVAMALVAGGLATCVAEYARLARRGLAGVARRRRRLGAYLAHAGILLLAAGVAGSQLWQQARQVELRPGQSVTVAGHTLTYEASAQSQVGDHVELVARLRMGTDTLEPARLTYTDMGGQPVSRVAIRTTPADDVYVVLAGAGDGTAAFDVYVNPLVTWIWVGAALLVSGMLLGNLGRLGTAPEPARLSLDPPIRGERIGVQVHGLVGRHRGPE